MFYEYVQLQLLWLNINSPLSISCYILYFPISIYSTSIESIIIMYYHWSVYMYITVCFILVQQRFMSHFQCSSYYAKHPHIIY